MEVAFIAFLAGFAAAAIAYRIADSKGRDAFTWAALSFFFLFCLYHFFSLAKGTACPPGTGVARTVQSQCLPAQ